MSSVGAAEDLRRELECPTANALLCGACIESAPCPKQYRGGQLTCHDCGLAYGGPGWMDAVIPDQQWRAISPTGHEGGILCITCMAGRLERHGYGDGTVPLRIRSGVFDPRREAW